MGLRVTKMITTNDFIEFYRNYFGVISGNELVGLSLEEISCVFSNIF